VHAPASRLDASLLVAATLHWATDSDFPWLRSEFDGKPVFLRMNTAFPDVAAYSLLVDEDETVDFDDLPASWTRGTLQWAQEPDS
jgi:hypothetical protein